MTRMVTRNSCTSAMLGTVVLRACTVNVTGAPGSTSRKMSPSMVEPGGAGGSGVIDVMNSAVSTAGSSNGSETATAEMSIVPYVTSAWTPSITASVTPVPSHDIV